MTSEGLGEMFEGDSADMCAVKFPLVSMGGRAEGLTCADPGARTPIGASGNFIYFQLHSQYIIFIQFEGRTTDICDRWAATKSACNKANSNSTGL